MVSASSTTCQAMESTVAQVSRAGGRPGLQHFSGSGCGGSDGGGGGRGGRQLLRITMRAGTISAQVAATIEGT